MASLPMTPSRVRSATQAQQSDVQRRHEVDQPYLSLIASQPVEQARAVRLTGLGAGEHAPGRDAIGISLVAGPLGQRFTVATAGQYVRRKFFNWQAGPVYYDAAGRLYQGAGNNASQIAVATAATELLVIASVAAQAGGGAEYAPVTYGANLVAGQIVYLNGQRAYPVSRDMPEAVTKLLAQVLTTGSAGSFGNVLVDGPAQHPSYALSSGLVFLGEDGFPTSSPYNETSNYVPLGFSRGGNAFNFAPEGRYFRSS